MNSLRFTTLKQHFSAPPVHSSAHAPPPRPFHYTPRRFAVGFCLGFASPSAFASSPYSFIGVNLFISLSVIGVIESSGNRFSCFTCIYSLIIGLGVPSGRLGDLHANFEKMNAIRRKKNVMFQVKEYEWMVEISYSFLGFYAVKTLLNNNIAML